MDTAVKPAPELATLAPQSITTEVLQEKYCQTELGETSAEQVLTAGDVRTATGQLNAGGTATFVYSRDEQTGVLVMNNAAPAPPGMVYQMWLMTDQGPKSAGMMPTMLPSTTAMVRDLGDSTALAFTMEPDGGSAQPTGEMVARLALT